MVVELDIDVVVDVAVDVNVDVDVTAVQINRDFRRSTPFCWPLDRFFVLLVSRPWH